GGTNIGPANSIYPSESCQLSGVVQRILQGRQHQVCLRGGGVVPHQANTPNICRIRSGASTNLQALFLPQVAPHSRRVPTLRDFHGSQLSESRAFLGEQSESHLLQAILQSLASACVTGIDVFQAFRQNPLQPGLKRNDHTCGCSVVISPLSSR